VSYACLELIIRQFYFYHRCSSLAHNGMLPSGDAGGEPTSAAGRPGNPPSGYSFLMQISSDAPTLSGNKKTALFCRERGIFPNPVRNRESTDLVQARR
jgi:hypothetical protein